MREASNKSLSNRICYVKKDNGNLRSSCFCSAYGLVLERNDQVYLCADELLGGSVCRSFIGEIPPVELDIFSFLVAQLLQALPQSCSRGCNVIKPYVK